MAHECTIEGWGPQPGQIATRMAGGKIGGRQRALVIAPPCFRSNGLSVFFASLKSRGEN